MFKNYKDCTDYLFSLERAGIKYSLNNIRILLSSLGNPHKELQCIHIAGTNGKGSVASIINSVLIEHGYLIGLYTSPHIIDFRERIRVNGSMIPKDFVIHFMSVIKPLCEKIKPSFFEASTTMALSYFSDTGVDFAVLEAGLGGRLDSTNEVKPLISVITGVSIDHTEYLGNRVACIAKEKAGIIKKRIPVVTGNLCPVSLGIVKDFCVKKNSVCTDSRKECKITVIKRTGDNFVFDLKCGKLAFKKLCLPLAGEFQSQNLKTSFTVLNNLFSRGFIELNRKSTAAGLLKIAINSGFRYRFQVIKRNPQVIVDVSHNIQGIKNIKNNLEYFEYRNLFVIFAMMSDKNHSACISELEKLNGLLIFTKPSYKRAEEPLNLLRLAKNKARAIAVDKIKNAYSLANILASKNDLILVTGSFFLVSDFLKIYKQ